MPSTSPPHRMIFVRRGQSCCDHIAVRSTMHAKIGWHALSACSLPLDTAASHAWGTRSQRWRKCDALICNQLCYLPACSLLACLFSPPTRQIHTRTPSQRESLGAVALPALMHAPHGRAAHSLAVAAATARGCCWSLLSRSRWPVCAVHSMA